MSAMPSERPQPSPNRDIVQRFREEYAGAIADARVSEEHTRTEGWQRLYKAHGESIRGQRRELAKRMARLAQTLEDFGWNEDDEKAVKETVKASGELRDSDTAFERQAVEPVSAPVSLCERIAEKYMNEARRDEGASPLHNVGLIETMRIEIAKQPRPVWDAESGMVEIRTAI